MTVSGTISMSVEDWETLRNDRARLDAECKGLRGELRAREQICALTREELKRARMRLTEVHTAIRAIRDALPGTRERTAAILRAYALLPENQSAATQASSAPPESNAAISASHVPIVGASRAPLSADEICAISIEVNRVMRESSAALLARLARYEKERTDG